MKTKAFIFACFLLGAGFVCAQSNDPVIMNVAGQDITRSEFEYAFNKNSNGNIVKDSKAIADYVDLFVNYKMKVKAATDAHLDTMSSFIKEYRQYRDLQLKPYVKDENYIDSVARVVYANVKKEVGDSDIIRVAHILVSAPKKAPMYEQIGAKTKIDSIYRALQKGADFAELAKKCSQDYSSVAKGGELPWLGPGSTMPEFEKAAYALQENQMSQPVRTAAGYHIILMKERKKLEPYEVRKPEIVEILKSRGIEDQAMQHKINTMVAQSGGKLTREDIMAQIRQTAEEKDSNLKNLINEYHDGLLLYEASNRFVWKKAAADKDGIANHFKANKKKFAWDKPRFRGFVVMGRHQKLTQDVAKFLKKYTDKKGIDEMEKHFSKDSLKNVSAHFGLFKEGENKRVDVAVYKTGTVKTNKIFPYYEVVGKLQKQPKSYLDDEAKVTSDYQDMKEKEWVDSLRKKYSYTVNKDVLGTVNNH